MNAGDGLRPSNWKPVYDIVQCTACNNHGIVCQWGMCVGCCNELHRDWKYEHEHPLSGMGERVITSTWDMDRKIYTCTIEKREVKVVEPKVDHEGFSVRDTRSTAPSTYETYIESVEAAQNSHWDPVQQKFIKNNNPPYTVAPITTPTVEADAIEMAEDWPQRTFKLKSWGKGGWHQTKSTTEDDDDNVWFGGHL